MVMIVRSIATLLVFGQETTGILKNNKKQFNDNKQQTQQNRQINSDCVRRLLLFSAVQ